jgi:hypothetical protein
MEIHNWKWFNAGRIMQVKFRNGADIAALSSLDRKHWLAMSMPVAGVRFDSRTLELMDTDKDGRIRTGEVVAAVEFLKGRGVDHNALFNVTPEDHARLADVMKRIGELSKAPPSEDDLKALKAWEESGKDPSVSILGENTVAGYQAFLAVEKIIDDYFTPPEDMPLVSDEPDKILPLDTRINPKHQDAVLEFANLCVSPLLDGAAEISRRDWKKIKSLFSAYANYLASKPTPNAPAANALEDEEREARYKLYLLEFLENFTNMANLYRGENPAIFQTGTLRIDAREMNLCFHVDSEAAHSALANRSKCCILYLKLTRKAEGLERLIAAVVTAGTVSGLYVGRNGVFVDRDGRDWEAVVTKVVESQVSLQEAFWAPWKKLGECIASAVKKILGDRQAASQAKLEQSVRTSAASPQQGAAMASSIAAVGIGVGMAGAALASVMSAIAGMPAWKIALSVLVLVLVVSVPSVVLTWFKLRARDIGAILNASGWAINRPMYFSAAMSRQFTKCAAKPLSAILCFVASIVLALAVVVGAVVYWHCADCKKKSAVEASKTAVTTEVSK